MIQIAIVVSASVLIAVMMCACSVRNSTKRKGNAWHTKLHRFSNQETRKLQGSWQPRQQSLIVVSNLGSGEMQPQQYTFQTKTREWTRSDIMTQINAVLKQYQIPGCLLQLKQQSVTLERLAVGTTHRSDLLAPGQVNQNITADMYFRIGSITKSMTATCILLLVQQGKLSLEDKLNRWFWGDLQPPHASKISILQMLNMTSGLAHYEQSPQFGTIFETDPEIHWDPRDLIRWSNQVAKTSGKMPGESWDYCNTGYILSGMIVERCTGVSLAQAFQRMLFEPLGMLNTRLATDSHLCKPHAQGYGNTRDKLENVTDWNPMWAWAAGGVISNLEDMTKWASNLGNSTLFKGLASLIHLSAAAANGAAATIPNQLNASGLTVPSPEHKFNLDYFYGLGVLYDHQWVWHNGSIPGWESIVAYHKPTGYSLVINVNQSTLPDNHSTESPVTELFRRLVQVLTPETLLHPVD